MCCALNRSSFPDQCLSNGLCGGGGHVFRDSCTDPTWKSPLCLQLCIEGSGNASSDMGISEDTVLNYSSSDVQVTDCNDGSYCCGADNTTCCSRGDGIRIASILAAPLSASSTSSATTMTTGLTTASTSRAFPTTPTIPGVVTGAPKRQDSSGLSTSGTIGVAVGCSVVGIMIAGALVWVFLIRKRSSSKSSPERISVHEIDGKSPMPEKDGASIRHELWDREPHTELDANRLK